MSDLTNIEKRSFEKLFGMGTGYVLDFSNRTFEEFVLDSTGKGIYDDPKYEISGTSKASRLRAFWSTEPNYVVAQLLGDILQYARVKPDEEGLLEACQRAVVRLMQISPVPEIQAITPNTDEKGFAILAKMVREAIERNEPESGLDRLHTFVVKYMRVICQKHGITTEKDKPLHSLVGEYIRRLKQEGTLESEMTERILKASISTLEAFNRVRNDHSFAHDNPVLSYDESLLIYNHVTSAVRFIEAIERRTSEAEAAAPQKSGMFPF